MVKITDHRITGLLLPFLLLCTCQKQDLIEPAGFEINIEADTIVFAQIGDYGFAGTAEKKVSELVNSWNPDFIVSVGDNNYTDGKLSTIKDNITRYYGDYIYNFDAPSDYRCNGKSFEDQINRFFPTPGNHDGNNRDGLVPYYNFFTLPGNEIYYKFSWGPVTFYSINSVESNLEEQKSWLEDALIMSTTPFNVVFLHHPPYSSGSHGDQVKMQWDFNDMGADIVFAGHDHIYERTQIANEDVWYIVNGIGGRARGECNVHPGPESLNRFCYVDDYGAVKAMAGQHKLVLEFYAASAPYEVVDRFEIISNIPNK